MTPEEHSKLPIYDAKHYFVYDLAKHPAWIGIFMRGEDEAKSFQQEIHRLCEIYFNGQRERCAQIAENSGYPESIGTQWYLPADYMAEHIAQAIRSKE